MYQKGVSIVDFVGEVEKGVGVYWRVKKQEVSEMLKPKSILDIPEETRAVAKKAFPKGNTYLKIRDKLGPIFEDDMFTELYPDLGQPAASPARLVFIAKCNCQREGLAVFLGATKQTKTQEARPMLIEKHQADNIFRRVPGLTLKMNPELSAIDQVLDDDELFRLVRDDLAQRYPRTEVARPSARLCSGLSSKCNICDANAAGPSATRS